MAARNANISTFICFTFTWVCASRFTFFIIHVNFTDFTLLKDVLSSSKTHICPRIARSFGVNAMKVSER